MQAFLPGEVKTLSAQRYKLCLLLGRRVVGLEDSLQAALEFIVERPGVGLELLKECFRRWRGLFLHG